MKKLTIIFVLSMFTLNLVAQNTMVLKDSTNMKAGTFDQQYDYENYLTPFPPKKRSNWVIGLGVGSATILGDIRANALNSIGADLHIQKSFTHVFALRFQSVFAEMKGVNYFSHPYGAFGTERYFLNYKTRMTDHTLQGVFTLNNINFHKRQPKVAFNVMVGAGVATAFSQTNYLDENGNTYDYSGLSDIETYGDRRFRVNELMNLMDDSYETTIKPKGTDAAINDTRVVPTVMMGAGLDFNISRRIDIALEGRISKHYSDWLDGFELGSGDDWLMYLSAGVNFKLGKGNEPLNWQNPLDPVYTDVMNLKQSSDLTQNVPDIDQDGVMDALDRDNNTPYGAPVNTYGVALDSDRDGVPDYRDKEIYSPTGAKVTMDGVALDSDFDGVPDVLDEEMNTPAGAYVDAKGRAIKSQGGGTTSSVFALGADFWSIFFDTDDATVKAEFNTVLLNIASYMIANPNARISLTGYTDSRSSEDYNMLLSKKRANNVLAKFTELGVDANRFDVAYKGESNILVEGGNSALKNQLNRRVTLELK